MMKVLPSLFTLGNLLSGFAAIFYASRVGHETFIGADPVPPLVIAASLVFAGMVFDALDGRVARLTRQTSELGEQLDSMADMVTFGAAPAFLVIQLIGIGTPFFGEEHPKWDIYFDRAVLVVAGVYVACTALRLARFNIEIHQPREKDHTRFEGRPSPAAAGTVCSLVLLHQWLIGKQVVNGSHLMSGAAKVTTVGMVLIAFLAAVAMVSTTRYSHVVNRYLRDRAPIHYIGAAVFILIPLLTVPQITLAAGFVIYALSAPLGLVWNKIRWPRPLVSAGSTSTPQAAPPAAAPQAPPPLRIKQI